MIASLPMYDLPEARGATDQFWAALADALGIDLPLARVGDHTIAWQRPDLIFSQTCGYPFTHAFAGKLTYVATPHYDADGCEGPDYCSILFAREAAPLERFRGKIAAYNNPDSMSGMLALKLVFAPLAQAGRFFENAVETGGHAASLAALQNGIADVAAVDCVTVALLRKHRPQALRWAYGGWRVRQRCQACPMSQTAAPPQNFRRLLQRSLLIYHPKQRARSCC